MAQTQLRSLSSVGIVSRLPRDVIDLTVVIVRRLCGGGMAPKGQKRKAGADSATAPEAAAAVAVVEADAPALPGDNSAVFERIKDTLDIVLGHPIFKKVVSASPLAISGGEGAASATASFQEPFSPDSFKAAIAGAGRYQCGINIMWTNFLYSAMPGIPVQQRAIDECQQMYYSEPAPCPRPICIAVESPSFNPLQHQGALQKVSPGEPIYAFLQAVRSDIDALNQAEAVDDKLKDKATIQNLQGRLQKWKQAMLTSTGLFVVLATADDKWWYEHNLREEIATDFRTMARTTFQKICEVLKLRAMMVQQHGPSAVTQKFLAKLYEQKAKMSQGSEPVTEGFIRQVTAINECLFSSCPVALDCIRDLDARYGVDNPLNGITKLHSIAKAARATEELEWLTKSLWDHIVTGVLTAGISLRDLTAGRSLLAVYLLKRRVLGHLLAKADVMLKPAVAERFRVIFANHVAYRTHVKPHAATTTCVTGASAVTATTCVTGASAVTAADISYQADWSTGTRMFATFVEDVVYKHDHPYSVNYTNCIKAGKSVTELFEYQAFEETWSTIKATLEEEKRAEESRLAVQAAATTTATASTTTSAAAGGAAATAAGDGGDGDDGGDTGAGGSGAATDTAAGGGGQAAAAEYWSAFADNLLRSRVTLKVAPKNEDLLVDEIKTSPPVVASRQPGTNNLIIHYDTKLASEANSRPSSRKAPLRDVHMKACVKAARKALAAAATTTLTTMLRPGDLFVFQDQAGLHLHIDSDSDDDSAMPTSFKEKFRGKLDIHSNPDRGGEWTRRSTSSLPMPRAAVAAAAPAAWPTAATATLSSRMCTTRSFMFFWSLTALLPAAGGEGRRWSSSTAFMSSARRRIASPTRGSVGTTVTLEEMSLGPSSSTTTGTTIWCGASNGATRRLRWALMSSALLAGQWISATTTKTTTPR